MESNHNLKKLRTSKNLLFYSIQKNELLSQTYQDLKQVFIVNIFPLEVLCNLWFAWLSFHQPILIVLVLSSDEHSSVSVELNHPEPTTLSTPYQSEGIHTVVSEHWFSLTYGRFYSFLTPPIFEGILKSPKEWVFYESPLDSGGRTWTSNRRVMGPTNCQLLYPASYGLYRCCPGHLLRDRQAN